MERAFKHSRCFVTTSRFETDETVLDNVDPTDAVFAGQGVRGEEELRRFGLLAGGRAVQGHGQALFELDDHVLGLVGGLGDGVGRQLPEVLGRGGVRVLEDAGLVGAVGQVLVHGPRLGLGLADGDALLGCVLEEIVAALEEEYLGDLIHLTQSY